jgi:outer membrane protein OmpA-like peptidoglycan-associated protein
MRVAENARALAEERSARAVLAAEREASNESLTQARTRAEEARAEARNAQGQAWSAERQAETARQQAEAETRRAERARSEAEIARLGEAAARAQAEEARRQAEEAKAMSQQAQQKLYESLSAILETRREARGLIVSMSDVLFDFGRAGLTPVARERLSRLSGALLAYPGNYRISTEGHTDSVGSADFNLRLSQERAENVLTFLAQAGVPGWRLGSAAGLGETRPVADNVSAAGRQANRRVEIVIGELDL